MCRVRTGGSDRNGQTAGYDGAADHDGQRFDAVGDAQPAASVPGERAGCHHRLVGEAAEYLHALVEQLNSTPDPDPELIARIGVSELENLLRDDEVELWPEIVRIARRDPRFR